jgi:hypothetical protein
MNGERQFLFFRAMVQELKRPVEELSHLKRHSFQLRLPRSIREKSSRSVTSPSRVWLALAHISA